MARHRILSHLKPVGVVAAISSVIQGTVWAVLYLLALLHRYCVFPVDETGPVTFKHYLLSYLQDTGHCTQQLLTCVNLTGPGIIATWLVIGIISNVLLVCLSITLIVVLCRCKKGSCFSSVNVWIGISLVTLAIDFSISIIFAIDYFKLEDATCLNDRGLAGLVAAFLLLLSSRGFILFVANLSSTIFFIIASVQLYIKYKIKNNEMDLISNWPSASSQNSSFDFYENKGKNELVGIVNPIQEYPEYSAKGRWPTLSNPEVHHRQPLRAWDTIDLAPKPTNPESRKVENNNYKVSTDYQQQTKPPNQEYNNAPRNQPEANSSSRNERVVQASVTTAEVVRPAKPDPPPREEMVTRFDDDTQDRLGTQDSQAPARKYSKTIPARMTPAPPPMPAEGSFPVPKQVAPSSEVVISEPDYTPPPKPKQFSTVKAYGTKDPPPHIMSLHEAIKSRPPLRPVLQRMNAKDY